MYKEEGYITIGSAAKYAGVSQEEIYRAISEGKVKSINTVGSLPGKVYKKSVEEFFAKAIEEKNCKTMGLVQAARFLKVSRIEFYRLINDGVFKTTGEGFDSQIKLEDLEAYLSGTLSSEKEDKY